MGNFRSDNRAREFGGRSRGGFGRDRDSRMSERRPREMHEVTCDKCGKQCQVPFRPSGGKPVFCSDCFRNEGGSSFRPSSRDNSYSRDNSSSLGNSSSSGISQEQYKEINTKLNKILGILEMIEFEEEDSEDESEDEETEE